ncbi:hypothetical protein PIB30_080122 [Stylosanthes scabra]|uniref:Uncharacterized protein n=1 Tax=Stylosanthes scabra TaxID=79078 RepID=A0ABU6STI9_9FABA|nr:hypothetical protein [Stylosanthes scabra]
MVGLVENVMLQVKDLMFPMDFYVLDMPSDTPRRPSHRRNWKNTPILWCDLNKNAEASTLEAKPKKLRENKALQDDVLNATTPMSTHSKGNTLVSSKGLKYVPPSLRQATKRGKNSHWIRDKKGKKDKGKLDESGKKKSVKTNGVAENVSYMAWNH